MLSPNQIAVRLRNFILRWRNDDAFRSELSGPVYEQNEGTPYILLEFDEHSRKLDTGRTATIDELKIMRANDPTIDHILAQSPTFSFPSRGFKSEEEYG